MSGFSFLENKLEFLCTKMEFSSNHVYEKNLIEGNILNPEVKWKGNAIREN